MYLSLRELFTRGRSTRYSDRLHDFSVTVTRCYNNVYVNNFFPDTARLWIYLSGERFPLPYDLEGLKSGVNRHIFKSLSSF